MTDITTAQMLEALVLMEQHINGLPERMFVLELEAIHARLAEFDTLKAEVERLKQQSDVRFYDAEFGDPRLTKEECLTPIAKFILGLKARAETAEAALEKARPLLEAVEKAELDNIKMDSMYADITPDTDWFCPSDDVRNILEAALAYRAEVEKGEK